MRCLIIGQGIAGSVLAWTLQKRGVQVVLADLPRPDSSSKVAAGIINPVTGKRLVKSWRFDEFYPVAKAVYQAMELQWGRKVWRDHTIFRLLDSVPELNDWSARMADPEYSAILGQSASLGTWSGFVKPGHAVGEIRQAARVDFSAIIQGVKTEMENRGAYRLEEISPERAEQLFKDFDVLIYCDGAASIKNPFFPNLPWQLSKGEALLLRLQRSDNSDFQEIIKKTLLLAPVSDGLIWAGSNYNWDFSNAGTTTAGQEFLEARISELLTVPYEIVHRFAAIRPTVKDRRPFLGISPMHSNVFIFNGLGTKGALLAPYWAAHLADHLLDGKSLDASVDINRFC